MNKDLAQQAKTFGDWAYLAIAKHSQKILKHEADVLKDKDPEDLHQMRVGMRRLRSAIAGFRDALDLPKEASESKVGKVARILGILRDIDVLEEHLKTQYQPILPPNEQKSLDEALKVLEKRRKKAFNDVRDIIGGSIYLKLKRGLSNWLESPKYQAIAKIYIQEILPDLLLPQTSRLMLHPSWLVGVNLQDGEVQFLEQWDKYQVEIILDKQGFLLHELRKEAKRSRYNMELFTHFYGEKYQEYLKDIKAIQTILGDIQDCSVLAIFLTDIFGESLKKIMPSLAEKFQETRYQKWQEWQSLQRKFLNVTTRKELHHTILQYSVEGV